MLSGALAGALLDSGNPLEGALIGGLIGGAISNNGRNRAEEQRRAHQQTAERQRQAQAQIAEAALQAGKKRAAIKSKLVKARQAIADSDSRLAKGHLGAILALDSKNAEAHLCLANLFEDEKRLVKVAHHLDLYNETAKRIGVTLKTAQIYAELGQIERAVQRYQSVITSNSAFSPEARKELVALYNRTNQHLAIIKLYPALSAADQAELQEILVNAADISVDYCEMQPCNTTFALVSARSKWQKLARRLQPHHCTHDAQERLRLLLERNQPQNFLIMQKLVLMQLLKDIKQELEPCCCAFFQPKYSQLTQVLAQVTRSFPDRNVDIIAFLTAQTDDGISLSELLQRRVFSADGAGAKAYQRLLQGLNEHVPGCGDWCNEALSHHNPAGLDAASLLINRTDQSGSDEGYGGTRSTTESREGEPSAPPAPTS